MAYTVESNALLARVSVTSFKSNYNDFLKIPDKFVNNELSNVSNRNINLKKFHLVGYSKSSFSRKPHYVRARL